MWIEIRYNDVLFVAVHETFRIDQLLAKRYVRQQCVIFEQRGDETTRIERFDRRKMRQRWTTSAWNHRQKTESEQIDERTENLRRRQYRVQNGGGRLSR